MPLSLDRIRQADCLLLECVAGSRAYGTDTPESDTDLRGVFVLPEEIFFGLETVDQISDEQNDETYYEIGRYVQLLAKNNPNILELLFTIPEMTLHRNELLDLITPQMVLSKLCRNTFAGYAVSQIGKARGLNKKIVNPMDGPRKSLLDFCYVVDGQGSIPVLDWLAAKGKSPKQCGLVKIPHMRDTYGVFFDRAEDSLEYRGIIGGENSTDLSLSSIPKGETPTGWMNFNRDGYQKYCREYREYQDWIKNRNESRYATNIAHGRNYDSKNMMHTFRLLDMAGEIASNHTLTLRRPNRDFLMKIRRGEFPYEELLELVDEKIAIVDAAFETSDLPETPDCEALDRALVEIRKSWYQGNRFT